MSTTTTPAVVHRIDHTGVNAHAGHLVYLGAAEPDPGGRDLPETEARDMEIWLPDGWSLFAREDGRAMIAHKDWSDDPLVSSCELSYDKHTRTVVATDSQRRQVIRLATRLIS